MLKQKEVYFSACILALSACSQHRYEPASKVQSPSQSERLGTKWGDEVASSVRTVQLKRVSHQPLDSAVLRYANKSYQGTTINSMSLLSGKVDLTVRSEGRRLPMYRDRGNYYVSGQDGMAYQLNYRNNSRTQTFEIVASVDGINVINGKAASKYATGYVLYPNDTLTIEGFRKSDSAVASFIFTKPEDAYAAHNDEASVNNTGIIGTVAYELYDPKKGKPVRRYGNDGLSAFPADNGYAKPPH